MNARLRQLLAFIADEFWILPGLMVLMGIFGAIGTVHLDRSGALPRVLLEGEWLYTGAAAGARTLLGAVASSTIGVAGTVFSITIAALSLAAGQMGPRLLRNFTRDRGNQFTLGVFLGTFSYALMVLRSVRARDEGEFVPHLSLTLSIVLAFICVGTLVYFVGHMAGRINVDTVIELVSADVRASMVRLSTTDEQTPAPPDSFWQGATPVAASNHGYLQKLDVEGLAAWAEEHACAILLRVRPGDYVFPNSVIGYVQPAVAGAAEAVGDAVALGPQRVSSEDLEYSVRQLVEVAVRALSPGINDPHTAMSALDRLGSALCSLVTVRLKNGVHPRKGKQALVVPSFDYVGLTDAMFHMIRQNARTSTAVPIRMLEVLTAVAACERDAARIESLRRHANLVLGDAERNLANPSDLDDIRQRRAAFDRAGVAPGADPAAPRRPRNAELPLDVA